MADSLRVSTEKSELDVALIHRFLSQESYWAKGIPLEIVERSLEHSLCFGGYLGRQQVAFARVVSDFATFAYLGDVFVVAEHRGKSYAKSLMDAVMAHPGLQGLRRFTLVTSDAHGLYQRYGFVPLAKPQNFLERSFPSIYQQESRSG